MGLLPSAKVPRQKESGDQLWNFEIPYEGIFGGSAVIDESGCQRPPANPIACHAETTGRSRHGKELT